MLSTNYSINTQPLILTDNNFCNFSFIRDRDEKFIERLNYHVEADDYFGTMATILNIIIAEADLQNRDMKILKTSATDKVFAFTRINNKDEILAVFNFSDKSIKTTINNLSVGTYKNVFTKQMLPLNKNTSFKLEPWGYLLLEKNK